MSSFEVQSLCKREIRRWIWLMAALFATITLFQYTQVLNVDLSFSSSSKAADTQRQQQQSLPPPQPQQEQRKPDNNSLGVNSSHLEDNQRFPDLLNTSRIEAGLALNNNISSSSSEGGIAPLEGSLDGDGEDDLDLDEANNDTSVLLESTIRREKHSNLVNDTRIEDDGHDEPSPPIMPILELNSTLLSSPPNNIMVPPPPYPPASPPPSPSPPPLTQKHRISPLEPLAKEVYSLRDMDELLTVGHRSTQSSVTLWSTKADQELMYVKYEIENAHPPPKAAGLQGPLYRNVTQFYRSYELMEKMLKVYVYKEGDRPVFHNPNLQGIYSSEGWFMKHMESSGHFFTKDPNRAHLFYLPFSSQMLVTALYVPNSHSRDNLVQHLKNFLDTVVTRYPFWNRTGGADHFLVSCHDWAPAETRLIMSPCIRALCNADVKVGFDFGKDVSLPETNVPYMKNPLRNLGGKHPSKRKTLAFFAGQMHGYLRPVLLQHWENVDPAMKIYGKLPHVKGNRNYVSYMQDSKYCICPRGYEVNSPRVVEAIFYECVPVIISDNFIPPLFETLNWESFAVFVQEKDVPKLKEILLAIPERTYLRLLMRVKMVQRHFLWHPKRPEKYDLFHMILHSIWYNRVFQFRPS